MLNYFQTQIETVYAERMQDLPSNEALTESLFLSHFPCSPPPLHSTHPEIILPGTGHAYHLHTTTAHGIHKLFSVFPSVQILART